MLDCRKDVQQNRSSQDSQPLSTIPRHADHDYKWMACVRDEDSILTADTPCRSFVD